MRGSVISLFGAGLFGLANFFIRRQLSVELSVADYGIFYGVFSLYSVIFCFMELGLGRTGTLLIAAAGEDTKRRDKVFTGVFQLKVLLSLCCAVAAAFWCFRQYSELSRSIIVLFSGLFVCKTLLGALHALWNGQKKYATQQLFPLLISALTLLCLLPDAKITLSRAAFFFFASTLAGLVSGWFYSRFTGLGRLCMEFDPGLCRELLTTGGVIAVCTTLISAGYYLDTVMLSALKSHESVGLYNAALPVMQIVQAGMVFPAVFLPIAVELNKNKEYTKLLAFVRYALLIALAALLPVWGFFYFTSEFLIRFLFDVRYIAAAPAIPILCVGLVFFTLGNFLMQIIICLKQLRSMSVISLITFVCNIVLNYILIKHLDFCGAAWAMLTTHAIFALLCCIVLEHSIKKLKHQ